ncbi:MAG TPA: phosphatidate cytidylyltransferase [Planctomycetota bacterium]|nr:phosphatidate cytidylyltransferase [Planctomycetota bacterium]
MVRKRVALGLAVSAAFLLLLWLDAALPGGPIFHILVGLVMIGTLLEVYGLAERHREEPMKVLPIALVVLAVGGDYALGGGDWGGAASAGFAVLWSFYAAMGLAVALGLWALAVAHLLARDPHRWLQDAPATIAGFLYVWFLGAHFFPLRALGMGYVLALVAVAKLGDSGAFFVGTCWGRHRLAPRTSPNKTLEGAAGGLVASVLSGGIVALLFGLRGGVGFWVVFGLVAGVAAQLGDLVASAMKRSAGAKDSGSMLSAFGGLLDIVDSPLMAAPVALWLLVAW